jgi:acetate---CoA ligase (ADP-forming)
LEALRQYLFAPASVAIVGQSDDPEKTAGRPLKFLRQLGYAGRIYPINPRRATVLGERAWPTLTALPEAPEHAYIVTPTDAAVAAVEECGRLGVKVATVLADGFAEAGSAGLARETRLRAACAASGMRLVGPSSLGVVDLRTKAMLTANAAFDETELPVGRIFAASHSGSLIGALLTRGKARGIGFAGLISVGNEVDLSLGDVCAATLDDPGIDGYMLFLETMRHAEALRRFALAAAARGKPIIAYKLGRSAAARELAVSHTGALAGEDDVADVFLKSCGIARVDTFDALLEGPPLLSRVPAAVREHKRVGVLTTTAGGATMVVDPLASRGITIEPASAATLARFAGAGIEVKPARMVDLTIAGARYETMKATLDILLTAPEFDLVLAVIGSSARAQPEATVQPLIESAGAGKPLAAFIVPDAPTALVALSRAGVPNFRAPEACANAIAAALSRHPPRPTAARSWAHAGTDGRMLDEFTAGALLERLGIKRAPSLVLEADMTQAPPLPFSYPVAVKVLSADIAHKSDVGGVALGVADGVALVTAIAKNQCERRGTTAGHAGCPRAGAAHDRGPRRSPRRLSRRPRRWPVDHGGGWRRAHRDRTRPQPAPRSGRSRRRARDDRRGARPRPACRLSRPAQGRSRSARARHRRALAARRRRQRRRSGNQSADGAPCRRRRRCRRCPGEARGERIG